MKASPIRALLSASSDGHKRPQTRALPARSHSNPTRWCRLLPAAVEVLLGAGSVDRARDVAAELDGLASHFGCVWLDAAAAHAHGAVEVASGDAAGALPYLRKAQQLWARAEATYDRSRARLLTGRALATVGDTESSRRDLEGAEGFPSWVNVTAASLVAAGGVLYTLGGLVYATKRPNPSAVWFGFHEVFHLFTGLAFIAQYVAVSVVTYSL